MVVVGVVVVGVVVLTASLPSNQESVKFVNTNWDFLNKLIYTYQVKPHLNVNG